MHNHGIAKEVRKSDLDDPTLVPPYMWIAFTILLSNSGRTSEHQIQLQIIQGTLLPTTRLHREVTVFQKNLYNVHIVEWAGRKAGRGIEDFLYEANNDETWQAPKKSSSYGESPRIKRLIVDSLNYGHQRGGIRNTPHIAAARFGLLAPTKHKLKLLHPPVKRRYCKRDAGFQCNLSILNIVPKNVKELTQGCQNTHDNVP